MIMSIILEWHNWSGHCVDDLSESRLTIYRNTRRILYEELDGMKRVLSKQNGTFSKFRGERFFSLLETVNTDMNARSGYSVDVSDGSCWVLKIRHSGNKLQTLCGAAEYPPHGWRIEQEMIALCEEGNVVTRNNFGCDRFSCRAVNEFALKWLNVFMSENPDHSTFEYVMGNDCFSIGFEMDCGESFNRAYSNGENLGRTEHLEKIIDKVDNVELLGSAIFSKWRYITHWSQESGFSSDNKAWFIMALNQLKRLTE